MPISVFESLTAKVEELLSRLAALKDENRNLAERLSSREAEIVALRETQAALEAAREEARSAAEGLLARIEDEISRG